MTQTKKDDKARSKRFIEKARELGADESDAIFERAFRKIVPPKRPAPKANSTENNHKSDKHSS